MTRFPGLCALIVLATWPCVAPAQSPVEAAIFHQLPEAALLELRVPARSLQAIAYRALYSDPPPSATDSSVRSFYPSGHLEAERRYLKGDGRLLDERVYRDNDRDELLRTRVSGQPNFSYDFQYDSTGLSVVTWTENGRPMKRSFQRQRDGSGRTIDESRALNGSEEYHYRFTWDAEGRKTSEVHLDVNGTVTDTYQYRYDRAGRLVQELRLNSRNESEYTATHQWNGAGLLTRTDHGRGGYLDRYTLFRYDNTGRKTEEATFYANGRASDHRFFTYDSSGTVRKSWTSELASDDWLRFDQEGHCLERRNDLLHAESRYAQGLLVADSQFMQERLVIAYAYQYDGQGRVQMRTGSDGDTVRYTYGNCGPERATRSVPGNGPYRRAYQVDTVFHYDKQCRLVKIEQPVYEDRSGWDLPAPPPPTELSVRYAYDRRGRLLRAWHTRNNDTTAQVIDWSYSPDGSREVRVRAAGSGAPLLRCRYGADGLLVYFCQDATARPVEHFYTYTFDERGNWIRRDEAITGRYGWTEHALSLRLVNYE
ncbi:hypothetical protein [Flaviaesturariibacter aridisoli]|uniref:RHS repeat protein n=1 Tax=Flaviaesturariibacter aridisoli TaxID=2545761 RepID=A0A4R4DY69_9BACT|nr:hypothetical protein [Flaviaesturariibacter aridisoli]TCZ68632.1 hypothetical protein E0486_13515 [Flaviaesturariibacter aridisoli]